MDAQTIEHILPGLSVWGTLTFSREKTTTAVPTKAEEATTKIGDATAMSEDDDGITRQLTPLSSPSSRCEGVVDAFSIEDVS